MRLQSVRTRALLVAPLRLAIAASWLVVSIAAGARTGVAVLAAIAVAPQPVLTALLAGVVAGLGLAAVVTLSRVDGELLVDPRRGTLYRP